MLVLWSLLLDKQTYALCDTGTEGLADGEIGEIEIGVGGERAGFQVSPIQAVPLLLESVALHGSRLVMSTLVNAPPLKKLLVLVFCLYQAKHAYR